MRYKVHTIMNRMNQKWGKQTTVPKRKSLALVPAVTMNACACGGHLIKDKRSLWILHVISLFVTKNEGHNIRLKSTVSYFLLLIL